MSDMKGSSTGKIIFAALVSALLTGVGAWFGLGSQVVTRIEMQNAISSEIARMGPTLEKLDRSIEGLNSQLVITREQNARMSALLERVMEEHRQITRRMP